MRRIVVCSILALAILGLGIWSVIYTARFSDRLLEEVGEVSYAFEQGDIEAARLAYSRARESWEGFRELHLLVFDQEHALEITMCMARIGSFLEQQEDDLLTECAQAAELIRVYRQEQLPDIRNIL